MGISIYPITPDFAAEVGDVDLSSPLQAADWEAISETFAKFAVLVFPDQHLTLEQHLAFAGRFGPLETSIRPGRNDAGKLRVREEIADVSNLDHENKPWGENSRQRMFQLANRLWHSDSSFRELPAYASLLYARSIAPVGGHTEFADMRAAFDALPEETRERIAQLVAEHSIFNSRAKLGFTEFTDDERESLPPVKQVMVRTIPQSGRRSLYLASHAGRVVGMDEAHGKALIDELMAHATQRQFVYTHRWRTGDLVLWDNRCTMHRGTDFDDLRWKRDVQRATVSDIGNTVGVDAARETQAAA